MSVTSTTAHRKIARTRVLQALAVALGLSAAGTAQAQEGVFMKDVLGTLGLVEKEREPIYYRERAPLVLPPRSDLPAPVNGAATRGATAAWPRDPEVTARERRAAAERAPRGLRGEQGRMSDNNTTLSINEMRAGRRPGAEVPTEATYKPGDNNRYSNWLDPFELLKGKKDDAELVSSVEPERALLSDPPRGYRRPPGGIERGSKEVAPYNPDRDESDSGAYLRKQAAR